MDLNHARLPIPPLRLTAWGASAWDCGEVLVSQSGSEVSIAPLFAYTDRNFLRQASVPYTFNPGALPYMSKSSTPPSSQAGGSHIPEELALEVRRLAHDLSNALEIIVQTSYLLSMAELKPPADDWLRMLDSGVQKALGINQELREYIKRNTQK